MKKEKTKIEIIIEVSPEFKKLIATEMKIRNRSESKTIEDVCTEHIGQLNFLRDIPEMDFKPTHVLIPKQKIDGVSPVTVSEVSKEDDDNYPVLPLD